MMKILKEITRRLGNGDESPTDRGYMTGCPCCGGSNTNLNIWRSGPGDIRGKCSKGCKTRDVLTVVRDLEKKVVCSLYGSGLDADNLVMGITEKELMEEDIPEPRMLIYPFLREQSICMIYAKDGTGKSWAVNGGGVALTRQNPIGIRIGLWEIRNGCGVLLVDGEQPKFDIKSNIERLIKGMGSLGEPSATNRLRIFSVIAEENSGDKEFNLADENFRNRISAHFAIQRSARVLILDNVSSLTSGIPTNSKQHWDPINDWLLRLRGQGIATIMVHHANKGGTDLGTSARKINIQSTIRLERDCEEHDRVYAKIIYEKCRGMSPGQGKSFNLELVGDDETGLRLVQPTP